MANKLTDRCPLCGRFLGTNHKCVSVDLKGERHCCNCGALLRNTGYERYHSLCPKCEKVVFRQKEREERKCLKTSFGGKCSICGYDRNFSALHFHHLDSTEKDLWNVKGKGGSSLREIRNHPRRFQLVCANCHIEIHNPEQDQKRTQLETRISEN